MRTYRILINAFLLTLPLSFLLSCLAGCSSNKALSSEQKNVKQSQLSEQASTREKQQIHYSDDAWSQFPEGKMIEGKKLQAFRYEDIHVGLAVPEGMDVIQSRLSFGQPVLRVVGPGQFIEITFSTGSAMFGAHLRAKPPYLVKPSVPAVQVEWNRHNVTVLTGSDEKRWRVQGWVRGARCESDHILTREQADAAFAVCASMRPLSPGPLITEDVANVQWPHRLRPAYAWITSGGRGGRIPLLRAGQLRAKLLNRSMPTQAEIRENTLGPFEELHFEAQLLEGSKVLVGRYFNRYEGYRYASYTVVWAHRGDYLCIATLGEWFEAPTDEEISYLVHFCHGISLG